MAKECKNCAHESSFKAHECGTCMVSYYDGEPLGLPSNFKSKIMTNADRIRAMSDEELAKLLLDGCRGSKCDEQPQNEYGSVNCFDCRMKWLKQPAEEGADHE